MVYVFRIISDEADDFLRDLEILEDQSFLDFHLSLQKELNYDPGQLASFFLVNDRWERMRELILFEMDEMQEGFSLMSDTIISDHFSGPRQKLLYQFDIFSDRVLFIELVEIRQADPGVSYPRISRREGTPPAQILGDDLSPGMEPPGEPNGYQDLDIGPENDQEF